VSIYYLLQIESELIYGSADN